LLPCVGKVGDNHILGLTTFSSTHGTYFFNCMFTFAQCE
jgi:hypothetical protein